MDGIPCAFFVCLTQTRLVSYFYQSNNLVFFLKKIIEITWNINNHESVSWKIHQSLSLCVF